MDISDGAAVYSDATAFSEEQQQNFQAILDTAQLRWLNVEELLTILHTGPCSLLPLCTKPPTSPPTSGTVLLYDRSQVRNFKVDGHKWIKKRNNPRKIREDHVKLRCGGEHRVSGTYVHSETEATMHRRAYRLIPKDKSPIRGGYYEEEDDNEEKEESNTELELVHYLDTREAARMSALYTDHLSTVASKKRSTGRGKGKAKKRSTNESGVRRSGPVRSSSRRSTQESRRRGKYTEEDDEDEDEENYENDHSNDHETSHYQDAYEGGYTYGQHYPSVGDQNDHLQPTHHARGQSLDVLWDMVLEGDGLVDGGNGQVRTVESSPQRAPGTNCGYTHEVQAAAASAASQHIPPHLEASIVSSVEETLGDVAASALSRQTHNNLSALSDEIISDAVRQVLDEEAAKDVEAKVMETVEKNLSAELQSKLVKTIQTKLGPVLEHGGEKEEMKSYPEMPPLPTCRENLPEDHSYDDADKKFPATTTDIPMTPLPEIVDFTPEDGCIHSSRPIKIIISASTPIPLLPPDDPPYKWQLICCFVDMAISQTGEANGNSSSTESSPNGSPTIFPFTPDPTLMKVAPSEAKLVTPYSCTCYIPQDISVIAGDRVVILVGVRCIDEGNTSNLDLGAISVAVKVCIQAEWNVAADKTDLNEKVSIQGADRLRPLFIAPSGSGNVQLLSQLSQSSFEFTEVSQATDKGHTGISVGSHSSGTSFPAPAPAIATVASALTELSSKPPAAALGKESRGRKRTLTLDDINESAAEWASSLASNSDGMMTEGEQVDRHCKIRYVERMANVIIETTENPSSDKITPNGDSSALILGVDGDQNLNDIDTEELDNLLSSVLMKFVETAVGSSSDEDELRDAINKPGFSGFSLIHYASLYNDASLIPLLLKCGADPNAKTEKGNLSPLHLAAGAGNDQIVDALVRHGARPEDEDSYGSTPSDHAIRNGFTELSNFISGNCCDKDMDTKQASDTRQSENNDMMQSAFNELNLKEKLGLGYISKKKSNTDATMSETAPEDSYKCQDASRADFDLSFINSSDKEALNTALSMLSSNERNELENYSFGVRKWMEISNYEALRDASLHLEKQAERQQTNATSKSDREISQKKLSQILAMYVLRKQLIDHDAE